MPELLLVLVAAGEAPAGIDPNDVTPGFAGFLTTFLLAVAVILLALSMVRRLRRIRYRAEREAREQADREQAQRETGGDAGDGPPPRPRP